MDGLVSINSIITAPNDAAIPALDRGFLFGDNVFEVIVSFENQLIDLDKHLARLRTSAENLEIPIPWSDEQLSFELNELTSQVNQPKTYLRLVVTRGSGAGIVAPANMAPNKIIYAFPAKIENQDIYQNGLALKRKQLPFTERGAHSKTGNYLRSILAVRDAQKEGFDEVIWSNSEGEFTEASTANIFFIGREGDLLEIATPSAHSGILKGLTRQRVRTLLNNAGIKSDERIIYTDELAKFDEAFICSTVRGLIPINKIDRHVFHTCRENSVFRKIESLYLTWLEAFLGHRVDWNTGKPTQKR